MNRYDGLTILLGVIALLAVLAVTAPAAAMNDPVTGRWITRDPLGYSRSQIRSSHVLNHSIYHATCLGKEWYETSISQSGVEAYVFLESSPAIEQDPSGLCSTALADQVDGIMSHRNRLKDCCQFPLGHSFVCIDGECHGVAPSYPYPMEIKPCTQNYPVCMTCDPDQALEDPVAQMSVPCDQADDDNRKHCLAACLDSAQWSLIQHCQYWVLKCLSQCCMKHCNPEHDTLDL